MIRRLTWVRSSVLPRHLARILIYVLLAIWSLICVFPLYWIVLTSLTREPDTIGAPRYLPFVDFTPSLEAWKEILTNPSDHLFQRYFNSVFVASTSTALTILLGGMAVYGLTRFPVRWPARHRWYRAAVDNRTILVAILATRVLPPMVVVLPIYLMAHYTGTLDTLFNLIFVYTATNLPVAVWLLLPVLGTAASDQEEAARLDGASNLRIFFEIAVPMAGLGMLAVGLLIFILCWNEYLFAAILTGDHAMTLPPWLVGQVSTKEAQVGEDTAQWPNLSAATLLMLVPVIACGVFVQRFRLRFGIR